MEQPDNLPLTQIFSPQDSRAAKTSFFVYRHISHKASLKNKIMLEHNMISLLQHGEKVLSYANKTKTINNQEIILLSAGNCLMSEKLAINRPYESLLFFFDNAALARFFGKYAALIDPVRPTINASEEPFIQFAKDDFIRNYIASLNALVGPGRLISEAMLQLKFEELMLYLLERNPRSLLAFQTRQPESHADFDIRKVVEMHVEKSTTLEELAFLCHMSVSTFKRRFFKLYTMSPSQYFRQRKMEMAASLLRHGENPSAVFYKVGFENHSSFSQSFKQYFQVSPSQYQQQNLTI